MMQNPYVRRLLSAGQYLSVLLGATLNLLNLFNAVSFTEEQLAGANLFFLALWATVSYVALGIQSAMIEREPQSS